MADVLEFVEHQSKDIVIRYGGRDTHIYLILGGSVEVELNGQQIAMRKAGTYVGEMALIDPTASRCANVVAKKNTLLGKIKEPDFTAIAEKYPQLWRTAAIELAERHREHLDIYRGEMPFSSQKPIDPAELSLKELILGLKAGQLWYLLTALVGLLGAVATTAFWFRQKISGP
jgi:signal-transduction protein with cAMP-binding, CBS, and nucleotidyltransferase domain